jgi:hypothetical protein
MPTAWLRFVAERDSRAVGQAWFQGMSHQLDDVPPAPLLREGQVEDATQSPCRRPGVHGSKLTA